MRLDYKNLNPAQHTAVHHTQSHLLIIAGPGTGKTHTLACRIVHLAEQLSLNKKILAITFTNKAAEEMKLRLARHSKAELNNIFVGTFHSFCLQFLKEYAKEAGLPAEFRIAAPEEIESLTKELWPADTLKARIGKLEKISAWKSQISDENVPEDARRYNQFLREAEILDFDDLLHETLKFLKTNAQIRKSLQDTYRFVCVDEYQDINAIQHALLKNIVAGDVFLTAIGDPNQAIYGFRGSDVRFFESFSQDFPGAVVLRLSDNYRSASNLLKASGQLIESSPFKVPALTAQIYQEGKLCVFEAASDKAEAEYVVHTIEKMVGGTSMFSQDSGRVENVQESERSFGDIAVLFRLKAQKKVLQDAFARSGIPYQVSGEVTDERIDFNSEKVNLMTLHASKGLEFPVVFVVGCEEGLIPLEMAGLDADREEERRLFYVGMTRAKEQLFLLHAKRRRLYGKALKGVVSPFLADIAEQLKTYEKNLPGARKKPRLPNSAQLTLFE